MSGFGQLLPILSAGLTYLDQNRQFGEARETNQQVTADLIGNIFNQARTLGAYNNRVNSAMVDQLLANVSGTNDFWASSARDILGVDLPGVSSTLDRDLLNRIAQVPNIDAAGNPTVDANGRPIRSVSQTGADAGGEGINRVGRGRSRISGGENAADGTTVPSDAALAQMAGQTGQTVGDLREMFSVYAAQRKSGASAQRASDMAALESARSNAQGANSLNYLSRIATTMGIISGLGAQESRDISERYRAQQGTAEQSLIQAGLSGGANTATMGAQFARAESAEQARLAERVRSMNANVYSQLSGDALAAKERLTMGYDAARRGDIASALGFVGQASANNVNQFAGLANEMRGYMAANYVQGPPQPNIGQAVSQGYNQYMAAAGTRAQIDAMNPSWYESILPSVGGAITAPFAYAGANVVGGGLNYLGNAAGFGNLVPKF